MFSLAISCSLFMSKLVSLAKEICRLSGASRSKSSIMTTTYSNRLIDVGLLVLRGAALLLALTFGVQKVLVYAALIHAGESLSTSGLAPLIRTMGFPFPACLAVCVVLNESLGALFMACGFLTRSAATLGVLGMSGALLTSLRLGEEPIRAALYLVAFLTLAVAGPGRFSVDHFLNSRLKDGI
jgi:putative oxidoreductase